MTYVLVKNNSVVEYPIYEGDIKLKYPNTSFTIPFEPPVGYFPVVDSPVPVIDYTQNISEGTPELIDGVWTKTWIVSEATPEEIETRTQSKESEIRSLRDSLLSKTDWYIIKSTETQNSIPEEVLIYRQALRDIPEQEGFPFDVVWPELSL